MLEPDALLDFVEDLGRQGARVAFDAATAPAYLTQAIERAGGKADIGADPITLMKATKNPVELAGARAAHERDGAAMTRFLAWFAGEAPRGRLTEIDAVEGFGDVSAREPRAQGPLVPDHRGRRTEFGDPPLSRQRSVQSEDRARHFSRRQRRAIRGRHDRHHPHDRRRAAERAHARPVHPRAERPHRGRPRRLSGRNERRADRCAGAAGALASGARFRPWHGARRRVLPLGSRRPAAPRQDRNDRACARHDRVQRARLLCRRRVRDPHREPGRGRGARRLPAANGRCSASRR